MSSEKKKYTMKIVEKGVDLDAVPDSYLAQRKKSVEKHKKYDVIFKEAVKLLKDMRWQDITFIGNPTSGYQIPVFPEEVRNKIKEAFRENNLKAKTDFTRGTLAFAKTHGNEEPDTRNSIHMNIDGSQRSHFPNDGIPTNLRGTNLGYKLYRALLEKVKWMVSNSAGTTEKDYVWQSLISTKKDRDGNLTEDDVHAIVTAGSVFAMVKSLPERDKIRIASSFISNVNKTDLTSRNFSIDPELKAILPEEILAQVDPARREALVRQRAQGRIERYAPHGIDAHDWEIGDYIVLKDYLLQPDYNPLPVRKVVEKDGTEWIALKMSDIGAYEATGTINDPRRTSRKTAWVKSQLQPGDVDPSAGRLARKGKPNARNGKPTAPVATNTATNTDVTEMTSEQKRLVKNYMRSGDFSVYVKMSDWSRRQRNQAVPIVAYLVKQSGTARNRSYTIMNSRTGQIQTASQAELNGAELLKMNMVRLEHKSDVSGGDYVFVKDHTSALGYVCRVQRITPAANQHTGVYIFSGERRPLYIGDPTRLYKLTVVEGNESVKIAKFGDFLNESL